MTYCIFSVLVENNVHPTKLSKCTRHSTTVVQRGGPDGIHQTRTRTIHARGREYHVATFRVGTYRELLRASPQTVRVQQTSIIKHNNRQLFVKLRNLFNTTLQVFFSEHLAFNLPEYRFGTLASCATGLAAGSAEEDGGVEHISIRLITL